MNWGDVLYYGTAVLLFAIVTVILSIIGLKRKATQEKRLFDMLLNNGALRVKKYLKTHETITPKGIGLVVKEVSAREFMSNKKAIVRDGRSFQDVLINFMLENNHLEEIKGPKGERLFTLKKKKNS